jgi:zinc-ribbon domain
VTRCPSCGAEARADATYCGSCGASLAEATPGRGGLRLVFAGGAVALLALTAAVAFLILAEPGGREAQVTEPQEIASCLDEDGAVFSEFGDDPEAVTLGVDLTGETSNAPGLYLYMTTSNEASRRVLGRLREIAESADVDVADNGRVLVAYVSEPTSGQRATVDGCLGMD